LSFQIKLFVDGLAFFWLGDCLGYFMKNWAIFFTFSGVDVLAFFGLETVWATF
jgi:hypothetical protein